jgi:hypothetical protein
MVHQLSAPLPTPPTSPSLSDQQLIDPRAHGHTRPALQLLDQLVNFYQQERVWVHHTRAALFELSMAASSSAAATHAHSDDPSPSTAAPDEDQPIVPAPGAAVAAEAHHGVPDVTIKDEPVDVDMALGLGAGFGDDAPTKSDARRNTRWMRRKNSMRLQLKLDGISPAARGRSRRRRGAPAPAPAAPDMHAQEEPLMPGEHGARLLQQFGDLMDARMESCQRVTRLVQEAGRQDLLYGDR